MMFGKQVCCAGVLLAGVLGAAPALKWNGSSVDALSAFGEIACNQSFSILLTFDASQVAAGDLFSLKGGGGNDSSKDVYKRIAVRLEDGMLQAIVAGKNGSDVLLGGEALLNALPDGMVSVAMVIETTTGTAIAPRAIATGGTQRIGQNFNFDNVAGSTWPANAPFDTWHMAEGVTQLEVFTSVAWSETEMARQVHPVATAEVELAVEGEVLWPGTAPDKVCFKGGTLVIPQGVTVETLRLSDDSGAGRLVVQGRVEGKDSGEPQMTALELPAMLTVELADGARFLMEGRVVAPVEIEGNVTLGAAREQGTLTLDKVTVSRGSTVSVAQGCLEVYAWPAAVAVEEGAAFRRWLAPGFTFKVL